MVLLTPVYNEAHELLEFSLDLLDLAAQELCGLPAHPQTALGQLYFATGPSDLLAHCCQVLSRHEPRQVDLPYRVAGLSTCRLLLQRAGEYLLIHVTDLTQPARKTQQQLIETVYEHSPAGIWVLRGPAYVFELLNPPMALLSSRPPAQALGRSYFEVLPEVVGQGVPELFHQA